MQQDGADSLPERNGQAGLMARLWRERVQEAQEEAAELKAKPGAGALDPGDCMKMESRRFSAQTKSALRKEGLSPEAVLSDPDKAESFVAKVTENEGLPDGNGGTVCVQGVVAGHYDRGGHGVDLVAADVNGAPVLIEVKKHNSPAVASLEDEPVKKLEPTVEAWRQQREKLVLAEQQAALKGARSEARDNWKPEVAEQQRQVERDTKQLTPDNQLAVRQMQDLWARDRWLKVIKESEGRERLKQAGIAGKYLNYEALSTSPDLVEWGEILDGRTAVIVSGKDDITGKRLLDQSLFEDRVKRVVHIKLENEDMWD
jgi:hypothetical protein